MNQRQEAAQLPASPASQSSLRSFSGFILTHVYPTRFQDLVTGRSWREFLQFRVARLYPVHVVSMALMGAMFLIGARAGSTG
jgi:peptidoglycan/LPS O-acetylase OafA/YrhL